MFYSFVFIAVSMGSQNGKWFAGSWDNKHITIVSQLTFLTIPISWFPLKDYSSFLDYSSRFAIPWKSLIFLPIPSLFNRPDFEVHTIFYNRFPGSRDSLFTHWFCIFVLIIYMGVQAVHVDLGWKRDESTILCLGRSRGEKKYRYQY